MMQIRIGIIGIEFAYWHYDNIFSISAATAKTLASSKWLPIICKPTGSPSAPLRVFDFPTFPAGTEIAGTPANFTGQVYTSIKYIASGSSFFSPILNAGIGETGEKITSTV